ncbi:hypothetical protein Btru_008039 [Bulinus truncatus]|nr:hypothetical protein Btru_008039 [Bulinus truncatus]
MNQLISDQLAVDIYVNYVSLGQDVNVFGQMTNILTWVIFIKLVFRVTSNVSLLGLTISDLFSLVTLFFFIVCQTPDFYHLTLPLENYDVAFLTVGFANVACCSTAFFLQERCLNIALPLQVKVVLWSVLIVACISPCSNASVLLIHGPVSVEFRFEPFWNRALLGISCGHAQNMAALMNGSQKNQLIDDQLAEDFFFVNYVSLGQAVNVFGMLTNILSVVVFIKMGFRDTSNISLLGLTISDLCSLVTLFFFNICQTPDFYNLTLPFEPYDVAFLTVGWAHVGFARVTCCLTAFIILERCLCIALPLKVKAILRPQRTIMTVMCIFPVSYASIFPIYCTASLNFRFSPIRNRTLLVMTYNELRKEMESISSVVNNVIPVSSFIVIVVCTALIIYQLHEKTKWRKLTSSYSSGAGTRDRKLEKMVLLISVIFIVCYLPCEIVFVWMLIDPELRFDGQQSNLFKVCVSALYFAETVNASSNVFVYYTMSSKYRGMVKQLLRLPDVNSASCHMEHKSQ